MSYFIRCTAVSFVICLLELTAAAEQYVIPSGECVGVKIYTDGLMVVNSSTVTGTDGKKINIATGYGIDYGDVIKKIDGVDVYSNDMLADYISKSDGDITLTIEKDGDEHNVTITPVKTQTGPKLGLWLRDSTAGLGTITYIADNTFAALGHGICDIDTGTIMPIEQGIIQNCTITSIIKGQSGSPGAITGMIDGDELGKITKNSKYGLFGVINSTPQKSAIPVAEPTEVRTGHAVILSNVDGNGVQEYSVEITRVNPSHGTHDMVVKITDQNLIYKTGGIVQGMSGSPIIQNNKFVGAITHVFVNDPLSGYAIFAQNMINESCN